MKNRNKLLNKEVLGNTKDLYFYMKGRVCDMPCIIGFRFLFGNKQFENAISSEFSDQDLDGEYEETETIQIVRKSKKINRKRIRLGLSSDIRNRIYKRDNYTCFYCGWQNGKKGKLDKPLTIDHIVPKSHGGTSKDGNLVTCCWDCNVKKNDKFLKEIVDNWTFEPETDLKVKHHVLDVPLNKLEGED